MICIRGQTLSGFPLIVPHSIYYFNGGAKLCHSFLNVRHSFAKEPIKKIGGKDHMVVVFVVTPNGPKFGMGMNNPIVCINCKVTWSYSYGGYMPHGNCCEDKGKACIFDNPEIP